MSACSPTHCSPSRSSLSCCQADQSSRDNVQDAPEATAKDPMFPEKYQFPKRPEVDLSFRDLRYSIRTINYRTWRIEQKEILHGVSGDFKAGEFVAIIGPSGAGKSTLLNALAGYVVKGVKGEIYVNGKIRSPYSERWKKTSCYIQQDSLLRTSLTVGEAMTLAAHLKLGYSISSAYKHAQILELLEVLGLSHCYDTVCGRLSGGQKKRLDVAFELISNPSVLFLDEPTTGLDSSSCSQCIALLKRLAFTEKRTVICTIHQPSALILEMFDAIYSVAEGQCIYRGPVSSLLSHMASVGAHCPSYHNPADFLMEVAIGDYGISVDKLALTVQETQPVERPVTYTKISELDAENIVDPSSSTGFLAQCYLLYKRQLLSLKRDYTLLLVRLMCHFLIGMLFGYLYMGSGYRAKSVLANYVYLYGSLLLVVYTGKMAVTLAFPLEMLILKREHFNRWYRLGPYYISILLIEVPFQAACAVTYVAVSYWLTGQPIETNRIILFMVFCVSATLTAQAWGFFMGATTPIKVAVFAGPVLAVVFSVFGFCGSYLDLPAAIRWMFHISYFRAGFHSLLQTIYGLGREPLKCDDIYCHYAKPTIFLKDMDIIGSVLVNNLILILGIGVLMHLLTASALWCKLNRR